MGLMNRLAGLFKRNRLERELNEELQHHIELKTQENVEAGMSPEEAMYAALRAFGGIEQKKEQCRDADRLRWLDELIQDLRFGLRQLRRNPGFTAVVVITLALGIGANTAIFSVMDAVMLRKLPVRNPDQLYLLDWYSPQWPGGLIQSGYGNELSYPMFQQFAAQKNVFSTLFGFAQCAAVTVMLNNQASLAHAEMVTGAYFPALGIKPILGRPITAEDEQPGAPHAAVVSYQYWTRRLSRDPSVVGKDISVNGISFVVIGVAPPGFSGVEPGYEPDLWVPVAEPAAISPWGKRPGNRSPLAATDWWWLDVMGRLRRGITQAQARARLDPLVRRDVTTGLGKELTAQEIPHIVIRSASRGLTERPQEFGEPLLVLMAAAGLLLVVACANVAGLLLARATVRQREIATRSALGATRARLMRQLLAESLMLAGMGAAVGGIIAYWGTRALLLLVSSGKEGIGLSVRPDLTILAFTVLVAVLTGLAFGIAPAFFAARTGLGPALRSALRAAPVGPQRLRLGPGKALVVVQIGLSLMLLIGAGLLVHTLVSLKGQDLGFDQTNLLLFEVDPAQIGYKGARLAGFYSQLLHRIRSLPGVESATLSSLTLIGGVYNGAHISIEGYTSKAGQNMHVYWNAVGPCFFRTMGIPILLGRGITKYDTAASPTVAVINQAMSRKFFSDGNPIGRRFRIPGAPNPQVEYEIVGLVGNTKYSSLRGTFAPTAYFSYSQLRWALGAMHYEVRTAADPLASVPTVRRAVHDMAPGLPLSQVVTQARQIESSLMRERLLADISSFFGGLVLLLACVGLYGLMAYSVARRAHEIGIRMALGAQKRDVLRLVLGQGVILAVIGVGIGIAAALALTRFLSSMLYGVKPTDPLTLTSVSLILLCVALLACYIPARRAASVDPMVALRHE